MAILVVNNNISGYDFEVIKKDCALSIVDNTIVKASTITQTEYEEKVSTVGVSCTLCDAVSLLASKDGVEIMADLNDNAFLIDTSLSALSAYKAIKGLNPLFCFTESSKDDELKYSRVLFLFDKTISGQLVPSMLEEVL